MKQIIDWLEQRAAARLEKHKAKWEQRVMRQSGWRLKEGESTAPGTRGYALVDLAKRGVFTEHWIEVGGRGYWEYRLNLTGGFSGADHQENVSTGRGGQ